MAHRLLFEDKDDADLKEVAALIKNIRRPELRPRFNAVVAILDCAKRGFMVNATGEVPACVRLPFSVKLAYVLKSPTEEEKSLKKMSEENGQRRQVFQGKHGMFSSIIKGGFGAELAKHAALDFEADLPTVQLVHTSFGVSCPGAWFFRIAKMETWVGIALTEYQKDTSQDLTSFSEKCLELWREDGKDLPAGVLPRKIFAIKVVKGSLPEPWPAMNALASRKIAASTVAHVWNLQAIKVCSALAAVCKLVTAVLICQEEDPKERHSLATNAKDMLDRYIFIEEEIEILSGSGATHRVARYRVLHAFLYVFVPDFRGSLLPSTTMASAHRDGKCPGESFERVMQLLCSTTGFNMSSVAARKPASSARAKPRPMAMSSAMTASMESAMTAVAEYDTLCAGKAELTALEEKGASMCSIVKSMLQMLKCTGPASTPPALGAQLQLATESLPKSTAEGVDSPTASTSKTLQVPCCTSFSLATLPPRACAMANQPTPPCPFPRTRRSRRPPTPRVMSLACLAPTRPSASARTVERPKCASPP